MNYFPNVTQAHGGLADESLREAEEFHEPAN
jgi:hypothetical protein